MTYIKLCGLSDAQSVDMALQLEVDAIGFVFARGSVREIVAKQARPLIKRAAGRTRAVGVFKGNPVEQVIAIAQACRLDTVQLHDIDSVDTVDRLHAVGLTVVRAITASDLGDSLGEDTLLVDGPDTGSGTTWDWSAHRPAGEWILAGGLTPGNVRDALHATTAWGVDVSSGIESSRGVKDVHLMADFVAAVRSVQL